MWGGLLGLWCGLGWATAAHAGWCGPRLALVVTGNRLTHQADGWSQAAEGYQAFFAEEEGDIPLAAPKPLATWAPESLKLWIEGAHGRYLRATLPEHIERALGIEFARGERALSNGGASLATAAWNVPFLELLTLGYRQKLVYTPYLGSEVPAPGDLLTVGPLDPTEPFRHVAMYLGHGRVLAVLGDGTAAQAMSVAGFQTFLRTEFPQLAHAPLVQLSRGPVAVRMVEEDHPQLPLEKYGLAWRRAVLATLDSMYAQSPFGSVAEQLAEMVRGQSISRAEQIFANGGAPDFLQYLDELNADFDRFVATGIVEENDVIRPGRVYTNWRGHEIFLPMKSVPPTGYWEINPARISARTMGRMLAAGLGPLSIALGFHDTRHFEKFRRFPRNYMKPLRALAVAFQNPDHPLPQSERLVRFFYAYEAMALVTPDRAKTVQMQLPEFLRGTNLVTVDEVKAHYADRKFFERLLPMAQQLVANVLPAVEGFGGMAGDPSVLPALAGSSVALRENPAGILRRLALWVRLAEGQTGAKPADVDGWATGLLQQHGDIEGVVRDLFARALVAVHEAQLVSSVEMLAELGRAETNTGGKLYRMFVLSGLSRGIDGASVPLTANERTLGSSLQQGLHP